ncbi:UDP-glucose 4-epimerase family protein [Halomonadaceae bacterium KBTZ08]
MSYQPCVLITGANGFIGQRLVSHLVHLHGVSVKAAVRREGMLDGSAPEVVTGAIDGETDWAAALKGVDSVVHLAAKAHVFDESDATHEAFQRTNVAGTRALAEQAARAGVRRFVFVSTAKVHGEFTQAGRPFNIGDTLAPSSAYSRSKAEAEQQLRDAAAETGMEVVIIRPPLVYGPGVSANFAAMIHWLRRGIPLPLGRTDNARSLLALDNLVDLITTCLAHPGAANQTLLASDGEDVSTTQLLQMTAAALGCRARLIPVPPWVMKLGAKVTRQEAVYLRLFGSLQLDISHTRQTLGWTPPLSLADGLQQTANRMEQH